MRSSFARLLVLISCCVFILSTRAGNAQFAYWSTKVGGNGHYYEVIASNSVTWYQASAVATNKGGFLATITSAPENAFIYGLIQTNAALWNHRPSGNSWGPWIGGVQPVGSPEPAGGWSWVTGEPFTYSNWNVGEPSNTSGNEDWIHFHGQQAATGPQWNDSIGSNSQIKGFVIEYEHHPNAVDLHIARQGPGSVQITFQTRTNTSYTIQRSITLIPAAWVDITNVHGDGTQAVIQDPLTSTNRFYRASATP